MAKADGGNFVGLQNEWGKNHGNMGARKKSRKIQFLRISKDIVRMRLAMAIISADIAEASKFPGSKLRALDTAAKFIDPPIYEAANAETTYTNVSDIYKENQLRVQMFQFLRNPSLGLTTSPVQLAEEKNPATINGILEAFSEVWRIQILVLRHFSSKTPTVEYCCIFTFLL